MKTNRSRRQFLHNTLLGTASLGAFSTPYYSLPLAKAESDTGRLRLGAIGCGGQGRLDLSYFDPQLDIVALCDVDSSFGLAKTLACGFGRKDKGQTVAPAPYADYRRILDRDDIDVVLIATPDHWHTKIAVEALQAGKHVFCEKPLTLTLEENLLVRKAAEKYDRVFQVGTMQRCFRKEFTLAALIVRGGYLGEIRNVVVNIGGGPTSPPIPKASAPTSLDWNMWLGQAPYVDYIASADEGNTPWEPAAASYPAYSRNHYVFRWWYEYSGGKFTDWGAHHIDIALWAMDRQKPGTGPISVDGTDVEHPVPFKNGWPTVDDRFNTATRFNVYHHFADGLVMNVCDSAQDDCGILFEGTKGRIHVSRGHIVGKPIEEGIADAFTEADYLALNNGVPFSPLTNDKENQDRAFYEHKFNFIHCVQHGGKPISDVASHVQAAHLCHLSGIAARLGRKIEWDSVRERIVGDDEAASFFHRDQRKGFELPEI